MIALSIIPEEKVPAALSMASTLEEAVRNGAMRKVDELSFALLGIAEYERKIRISDAPWMEFNCHIRRSIPDYAAPYIVAPETCSRLLSLLEKKDPNGLRGILDAAVSSGSYLLQIPMGSE